MASPDDVRALHPPIAAAYEQTRRTVLADGIVDSAIKDVCARYLAGDDDVVAHSDDAQRFDERKRAALAWAHAIAWDDAEADEALWTRLHAGFTEPELVELGYCIAFTLGQQHWLATLEAAGAPGRPR
jgi:alkylhydroperoxidase family enzyme